MATYKGLGWTFDAELDGATGAPVEGGLVLENITHDGHNFAHNIRFIGVWIYLDQVDANGNVTGSQNKFVALESKLFTYGKARTLTPQPISHTYFKSYTHRVGDAVQITRTFDYLKEAEAALNFSDYFQDGKNHVAYGIAAKYDAPKLFADLHLDNCEFAGLSIEQIFLLGRYGSDPPHEPSGALSAVRFHPMVSYQLTANPDYDTKKTYLRLKSLRFDLRLHLHLDTFVNAGSLYNDNQAGLFADSDIGSIRALRRKLVGLGTLKGNSKIAFYAAEKSVVREVTAPGLVRGDSSGRLPGSQDDIVCWDNVHWWGADSPGKPMISSPGAFHAAHIHWRWGELLKSWLARAGASWRRFQPGNALLDPRVPLQTLLLAVTKFRRGQDPAHASPANLSMEKWDDLFHNKSNSPQPEKIQDGGNLVLWYSTEVHRHQTLMPPAGTVFLHGIFFAHDGEPNPSWPSIISALGSRDPLYWPRSDSEVNQKKKWFRPANG